MIDHSLVGVAGKHTAANQPHTPPAGMMTMHAPKDGSFLLPNNRMFKMESRVW
jgi:hypothetical protein